MTAANDKNGGYEISEIKTFKGHEGEPCCQGKLKFHGKVVCEWSEDSWGGGMMLNWHSKDAEKAFDAFVKAHPATGNRKHVRKAENVMAQLFIEYVENKTLKAWCKTNTLLKTPDDSDGPYVLLKAKWDQNNKQLVDFISNKYPKAEIVNLRFPELTQAV